MANLPNRFRTLGPHERRPQKVCFANGYVGGRFNGRQIQSKSQLALESIRATLKSKAIGLLACGVSCCLLLTAHNLTAV